MGFRKQKYCQTFQQNYRNKPMLAQLKQTKRKARSVSSFLKKTYQILEDSENSYAIKWSATGIGFIVVKEQQFSKEILPLYFKHSNYSSFVRQLNMYNFHKIREANSESHFHHEFFRKNNKAMLSEIKRKPQKKKRKNEDMSEEEKQNDNDCSNERSNISMKKILNRSQNGNGNLNQSEFQIKSYKETDKNNYENTHHAFKSEKSNQNQHISQTFSYHKIEGGFPIQNNSSKERVSIQNILVGSPEHDEDKLSINNEMQVFPRYPTKEIFCPSNNNIYPFPINFKGGNLVSQFNILF